MHLRLAKGLSRIRRGIRHRGDVFSPLIGTWSMALCESVLVNESSFQLQNGDKNIFRVFLGEFVLQHEEAD